MSTTIGQRIKELRIHHRLSVNDFSEKCGLSHVSVYNLESGKTAKPHNNTLIRISTVFNASYDWLVSGKKEMYDKEIGGDEVKEKELGDSIDEKESYVEIKERNVQLEKRVEMLWQTINDFFDAEGLQK